MKHAVLLLILVSCFAKPIIKPLVQYTSLTTIDPGTVDGYVLDYSCTSYKAYLEIAVDIPSFFLSQSGVFAFVSLGPATKGPFIPYPDPSDSSTFQWTTYNGSVLSPPNPSVLIPHSPGSQYYVTVTIQIAESPSYLISSQLIDNSNPEVIGWDKSWAPLKLKADQLVDKNKILFSGNQQVFNDSVSYNSPLQYELPICKSALERRFGTATICLSAVITGLGPSYVFFQYFTTSNGNIWNTRSQSSNPYTDLSGRSRRTINEFLSLPITADQLPDTLFQTVVGQGGQGLAPPYLNLFSVFYDFAPCSS
jgi:hypothetical protein